MDSERERERQRQREREKQRERERKRKKESERGELFFFPFPSAPHGLHAPMPPRPCHVPPSCRTWWKQRRSSPSSVASAKPNDKSDSLPLIRKVILVGLLDAPSHLYMRLCPSVGLSVGYRRVEFLRNWLNLNKIAPGTKNYAI